MTYRTPSRQTYKDGLVSFQLGNFYLMQAMARQARDLAHARPKDQARTWITLANALEQKHVEVHAKPTHLLKSHDAILSFPLPPSSRALRQRLAGEAARVSEGDHGPAFTFAWANLAQALREAAKAKDRSTS
jgi:hypothetical protein